MSNRRPGPGDPPASAPEEDYKQTLATMVEQLREWADALTDPSIVAGMREVADDLERK